MWFLIFHVVVNILGLIFLLGGSFQILLRESENLTKNKLIEWGWYLYTVGVILGAFLAKETYGYYWVWDLKETLSLITLLGYFAYTTFESRMPGRARRIIVAVGLILALITLLVPTFTYSYHNLTDLFA